MNKKKEVLFFPPDSDLLCWEGSRDPISIGWELRQNYSPLWVIKVRNTNSKYPIRVVMSKEWERWDSMACSPKHDKGEEMHQMLDKPMWSWTWTSGAQIWLFSGLFVCFVFNEGVRQRTVALLQRYPRMYCSRMEMTLAWIEFYVFDSSRQSSTYTSHRFTV